MKSYRVYIAYTVDVQMSINAKSKDDAIDKAIEEGHLILCRHCSQSQGVISIEKDEKIEPWVQD